MKTWFRKLGMGTVVLALAGVLGGCDDGGGGGGGINLIRLFFGINGIGNCDSVVIEVDLEAADAIIAEDSEGELQCAINAVLENAGCDIDFASDGDTLVVTIDGCTIPAVTNLFSCFFEQVDISDINVVSTADCDCTALPCDPDPPVCVSEDPDPTSCEDCDNGIDDDGDGDTDCDDEQCVNDPACTGSTTSTSTTTTSSSTTTSTSSTTTSSTSTTTSTTSTSLPPPELSCRIVFRLDDAVEAGSLQYDADYGDAPGFFVGTAGNVECASLIQGSIASFNDQDNSEVLSSGIISLDGFTGPIDVAECTFAANVVPVAADFDITVVDAADPDIIPIEPTPDVIISLIDCTGPDTTTTTEAPVTTLDTTTTTSLDTTTTTVLSNLYNVIISLDSVDPEASTVGALQFDLGYGGAPGEFSGSAASVSCTNEVTGSIFAPNDNEITDTLSLGFVSLTGFSPRTLSICQFESSGDVPVEGDFTITITDASDPNFEPVDVELSLAVTPKL